MSRARWVLLAGLAWGLAGCASVFDRPGGMADRVGHDMEQAMAVLAEARALGERIASGPEGGLSVHPGVWLGEEVVRRTRGAPIPERLRRALPSALEFFVAAAGDGTSRQRLVELVEERLGVRLETDPLLGGEAEEPVSDFDFVAGPVDAAPVSPGAHARRVALVRGGLLGDFVFVGRSPIRLLDEVTRALGFASWRYEGGDPGRVVLYRHLVREVPVMAIAESGRDALLEELREGVAGICGACEVQWRAQMGVFQVRVEPLLARRVDEYLAQWNRLMSEQLVVEVDLVGVTRRIDDRVGVDLDLAAVLAGAVSPGTEDGTVSLGLRGEGPGAVLIAPSSRFAGSSLVFEALSSVGEVTRIFRNSFLALNGRRHTVSQKRDLVVVVGRSAVAAGQGTEESEELRDINVGFELSFVARVLPNSRVLLHYEITDDRQSGGSATAASIRSDTERMSVSNETVLPLGGRLVISTRERVVGERNARGDAEPDLWVFGSGSRSVTREVETLVLSLRVSRAALVDEARPAHAGLG